VAAKALLGTKKNLPATQAVSMIEIQYYPIFTGWAGTKKVKLGSTLACQGL